MAAGKRTTRSTKGRQNKRKKYEQVSMEYVLTYGFGIVIIAIALVALYFFVLAPSSIPPNQCAFSSGIKCNDIVIGSNTVETYATIVASLSNSEEYSIEYPVLSVNSSSTGVQSGMCFPSYVRPGGVMICTISIKQILRQGTAIEGNMNISATVCTYVTGGSGCRGQLRQTFTGTFSTRTATSTSPLWPSCKLTLSPTNAVFYDLGQEETFTANVKVLGYQIAGATVNFTTNNTKVTPSPQYVATDINGNAQTHLESRGYAASVNLTGTFGICSNYTTVNFVARSVPKAANFAYVINTQSQVPPYAGNVLIIDTTSNTVVGVMTSGIYYPGGVAFAPSGTYAYVTAMNYTTYLSEILVISASTNAISSIITNQDNDGSSMAFAPSGTYAYIVNYNANNVAIMNTATSKVVGTITSSSFYDPVGVAIAPGGTYAYVTNTGVNGTTGAYHISIINTATNTVTGTITSGSFYDPAGVAFAPSGTYAYVANMGSGILIINTATNTVTGSITSGLNEPQGVGFSSDGTYAYVTNYGSNNVVIINTATNTVVGEAASYLDGVFYPGDVAIHPT